MPRRHRPYKPAAPSTGETPQVIHPVAAAKMGATIDFISGGRWGLNVVAGVDAQRVRDVRPADGAA